MDEFEAAGFDEETCEQLRKISFESGIEPERLICVIKQGEDPQYLSEYTRLRIAWNVFKQAMWDEFTKSKIGKFMIRLADKLAEILGRSEGE